MQFLFLLLRCSPHHRAIYSSFNVCSAAALQEGSKNVLKPRAVSKLIIQIPVVCFVKTKSQTKRKEGRKIVLQSFDCYFSHRSLQWRHKMHHKYAAAHGIKCTCDDKRLFNKKLHMTHCYFIK